jgi:hypothetical protein
MSGLRRKIEVVTTARADYSHLYQPLRTVERREDVDLRLMGFPGSLLAWSGKSRRVDCDCCADRVPAEFRFGRGDGENDWRGGAGLGGASWRDAAGSDWSKRNL